MNACPSVCSLICVMAFIVSSLEVVLSKNIANNVVFVLSFSKYFLNFEGTISEGTSSPTIPV